MRITVIGSGYVGLVTGACLSDLGFKVICLDKDEDKIRALHDGEVPIYEPGLKELLARNRTDGRIRFTTDAREAIEQGDVLFIAVGTPPTEDGSADLGHVLSVASMIGRRWRKPDGLWWRFQHHTDFNRTTELDGIGSGCRLEGRQDDGD